MISEAMFGIKIAKYFPKFPICATRSICHNHSAGNIKVFAELDPFTRNFLQHQIPLTGVQKLMLGIGSSIVSAYNPRRVDMVACCAEILCTRNLKEILKQMQSIQVGKQILKDKPYILEASGIKVLLNMHEDSFGWAYGKFLQDHAIDPAKPSPVKFISDPVLAFIMARCRRIHDYLHVLLDIPANKVGEILVKWVEALNFGLITSQVAAVIGCAYIPQRERQNFIEKYLPLAIYNGKNVNKYYLIYWEKLFEMNLQELRNKLGVERFPKSLGLM